MSHDYRKLGNVRCIADEFDRIERSSHYVSSVFLGETLFIDSARIRNGVVNSSQYRYSKTYLLYYLRLPLTTILDTS